MLPAPPFLCAFSLAVLWGCDPIILVGQDLAYTHGRIHAAGRPGGEDEERPETLEVPAIDGGTAQTSPVMLSYILWYEEAANTLKASRRRIINGTAAGAYLPGFEHNPFEEAVNGLPPRKEALNLVVEAVNKVPRPTASFLVQRIAQTRLDLEAVLKQMEQEGLEAAISSMKKGSIAAAVIENMRAGEEPEQTKASLKQVLETLANMKQGLHRAVSSSGAEN